MATQYGGSERRRFKRVKVNFIVNYSIRKPLEVSMSIGAMNVDARMVDLSEAGMAIASSFDIPLATLLLINFTLISSHEEGEDRIRKMMIEGEVVNRAALDIDEYRLGIQFTKIKEEDRAAIVEFVRAASF